MITAADGVCVCVIVMATDCSHIRVMAVEGLHVHYYSDSLLTQYGYCVGG